MKTVAFSFWRDGRDRSMATVLKIVGCKKLQGFESLSLLKINIYNNEGVYMLNELANLKPYTCGISKTIPGIDIIFEGDTIFSLPISMAANGAHHAIVNALNGAFLYGVSKTVDRVIILADKRHNDKQDINK